MLNALEQALVDSLAFFSLARQAFDFLRTEYHCWPTLTSVISPDDWRDAAARIRYPGEHVGVSIAWYFADAAISVGFVEQLEPRVFPDHAPYFGRHATSPLAVSLDSLVEMSGNRADPDFLLPADSPKRSKANARRRILEDAMAGVLDGLARATKRYATDILARAFLRLCATRQSGLKRRRHHYAAETATRRQDDLTPRLDVCATTPC